MSETSWRTLWVPLRELRTAWLCALANLVGYGLTLQRDLGFFDSSELAMVARVGGLGHPTGEPLHTLLAWPLAHIPGLPPHLGVALLSAIAGSLIVFPALSLVEWFEPPSDDDAPPGRHAAAAVLLFFVAQHGLVWDSATRVEVYALTGFFSLWTVAWAVRDDVRSFFFAGLGLGLTESTHPTLGLVVALAILPSLLRRARRDGMRRMLKVIGGGLTGLLPFVYVFAIAHRHPATFVWGAPLDAATMKHFFTGADYATNQGIEIGAFAAHFGSLFVWLASEGGVLAIASIGVTGWALTAKHDRLVLLLWWLGVLGLLALNVEFDTGIPDFLGYLLGAWWGAGAGAAILLEAGLAKGGRFRTYAFALLALVLLATAVSTPTPWTRTRGGDDTARVMVDGLWAEAPHNAVVVMESDYWVGPLLYATEAEHERSDVMLLPWTFASSSWWWAHLFAKHQDLRGFELRGPGGAAGRLARFAEANPHRPILIEAKDGLLHQVGRRPCAIGWVVHTGDCAARELDVRAPSAALQDQLDRLGAGSPPVPNLVAGVTLERGLVLWRMGDTNAALHSFMAGIPDRPVELPDVGAAPAWRDPTPSWRDVVPYGHPDRNRALAAELMRAAGQPSTLP